MNTQDPIDATFTHKTVDLRDPQLISSNVPTQLRILGRNYAHTRRNTIPPESLQILIARESARRQPGILDLIRTASSFKSAAQLWDDFIRKSNPSQKTINKALRLLSTLDFPA